MNRSRLAVRLLSPVAGLLTALAVPAIVHADAAGPTDYTTEIVAVSPETALDSVSLRIVGGDAFIEATVVPGHQLIVLGYRPDEEPYLRIGPDGVVEQNTRSYATYYNENRYGSDDIPDIVDTTAPPEWEAIAGGGTWAWHDHRAHWMSERPLIGLDPGDRLPPERIPMLLDGDPVFVDVVTTYHADPSPIPALVGVLLGVQIGLVGVWLGRATTVLMTIVVAGLGLVAGLAQFWSLPASTSPLFTWWLLPALALGCAIAVIAMYGRSIWVETGLVAIAAVQSVVWAWERRGNLDAAFVPTELPMALDRFITMTVMTGGAVIVVGALWQLWRAVTPAAEAAPE